jgi:hypothetical protein
MLHILLVLERKLEVHEKILSEYLDDINLIRLKWLFFVNQKNDKKCMILWFELKKKYGKNYEFHTIN